MLGEQAEMVAQLVHRDAGILGEEIAGVEDLAAVRIDQRIVVGAIGLGLDLSRRRRQAVEHRAEELRQAAQRIAVLDQRAGAMAARAGRLAADQAGAADQLRHRLRHPDLAGMRLHRWMKGAKLWSVESSAWA